MSHEFSLQCYLSARDDPEVSAWQYADLKSLLSIFRPDALGLDSDPVPLPDRFELGTQSPNLLIVEDDEPVAGMLRDRLVAAGYPADRVVTIGTGGEAVQYARTHSVGIALIDIKLAGPGDLQSAYTSGLQVLREVKAASPGAKAIVISGHATFGMIRDAILKLGASYFLKKPFKLADLVTAVHWGVERVLGAGVLMAADRVAVGAAQEQRGGPDERILVVDDDEAVAEGLALALQAAGYETATANGGHAALDALRARSYDAVLLDIRMPDLDGLEVLRRIRPIAPKAIVLVLTGVTDEEVAREALKLGAIEFLGKPCDLDVLQFTLEHAFSQRQE